MFLKPNGKGHTFQLNQSACDDGATGRRQKLLRLAGIKELDSKGKEHVLKGAAAAGEKAANAATAKNAHCHRGSGSNLNNLEGCLPAKTLLHLDERSCTLWHRAPDMKNFNHHWHEFYKVLYSLRLPESLVYFDDFKENENALNQEDSDGPTATWSSPTGSMTSGQPPMLSAEWVLFNISFNAFCCTLAESARSTLERQVQWCILVLSRRQRNAPLTLWTKNEIWLFFCWTCILLSDVTFSNWLNLRI